MSSPVFFDQSGHRRRVATWSAGLLIFAIIAAALAFAMTVIDVPVASPLHFGREREQPLPFRLHVRGLHKVIRPLLHPFTGAQSLQIGFYVPWDQNSAASLHAHGRDLDWVIADDGSIDTHSGRVYANRDPQFFALLHADTHAAAPLLMVQNYRNEKWDGSGMARLLANPTAMQKLVYQSVAAARAGHWKGLVYDLESLPPSALPDYRRFLAQLHKATQAAGLTLAVTSPAGQAAWSLGRFASAVDYLIFMDYDQHWQGGNAGPIADQAWFGQQLANARRQVPAGKLIVAIGSYGYDWHDNTADALSIEEALLAAHDSSAMPGFDPASGNAGFAYDEAGHTHTIWMMDAATSWNQLAQLHGVRGVALWRLGSEDPGLWEDLAAWRHGRRPNLGGLPKPSGTDVEGNGELLQISADPHGGTRAVDFDAAGEVRGERYLRLPTPYVVSRSGADDPHAVALTFDDGPDPTFTPRILSILERTRTPATFFVIGENALSHPALLRRIVADGHEIGNHSYTHPNLAEESALGTRLELNTTQRLIEAYTGRSTRLFRAPYFGDAEPTTADELVPAEIAQKGGYTIVGLHVDPADWRTPGVQAIVDRTVAQVTAGTRQHSANIVLLHDSGGNREQTVAALPQIIARLTALGYHFVPVSQLAGIGRDVAMPPVAGRDLLAVRADVAAFLALAAIGYALKWLFFFAIALGIARAALMTGLALIDRKASAQVPADAPQPPVSVIIPAYNEEKVIVDSIARVLSSDYPALELIVADDGSKDATSARVREVYGHDPRVTLLSFVNGGKAAALNRALTHASGEIVIALDADTQFLPDTIARLVRWFADPRIGAVAGNARVGNRINLATRWQAIEYVTAQNVERRALDALGAITVVPGAVGAWRRAALDAVGGYPEDTLAEDQDLTIAIQRRGWRIAYDVTAIALTEAPETFRALARQRYRWSFGTLQCLWKHRAILHTGTPRGLAWFGLPQAWLFQIVFAALSPIIDLALVLSIIGTAIQVQQHGLAQTQSDVLRMAIYWTVFVGVDVIAAWVAYRLEPIRQRFPAGLLILQRFVYRQLMYGVVLRSIAAAITGHAVGWGKLERTGSVIVRPTNHQSPLKLARSPRPPDAKRPGGRGRTAGPMPSG